jgi:two-component system sensor histidine kinase QseC
LITIATFIAAMHGYRNSQSQLDDILDNELSTLAIFILNNQATENEQSQKLILLDTNDALKDKAFQVFTKDERLVAHSTNAPQSPITQTLGFSEEAFSGSRWRTFRLANDQAFVVVAQSDKYRRNVTEDILLATLVPIVFSIPFIGLLVFYIIRKSLSPLRLLSSQLTNKHSEDLTGVYIPTSTKELMPVVNRLNALFNRLATSFELEKQLSANAAHELRTPISVLAIAATNLGADFEKGNLTREHFDTLNKHVERMAQVIEQIIGLFRFSADTIESQKSMVSVEKVLQEVVSNNYLSIENENQTIELEASKAHIFACELALYVLFENLLRNAIKYAGRGSSIYLNVSEQPSELIVDVQDSGKGLAPEDMQQLTQRFYRAGNQTNIKGSGLGLAICKHIVNLHKGTLAFSTSQYGGLHVRVTLPKEDKDVA